MFASQNGVLHTRALSSFSECARVPIYRIEGFGGRMIFVDADALAVGQRADASDQRPRQLEPALAAMSPMDEHPESCFVEPRFHSGALSPSSEAVVHTAVTFSEMASSRARALVGRRRLPAARRRRRRRCPMTRG